MSHSARSNDNRRLSDLEAQLTHKEHQVQDLQDDLKASMETTRRVNSRLISTLDALDALKSSYAEELSTIKRQVLLLQHKLARSTRDARLAELERDTMQAAVLQLIEKVELSSGIEGFEPGRLELPNKLEPASQPDHSFHSASDASSDDGMDGDLQTHLNPKNSNSNQALIIEMLVHQRENDRVQYGREMKNAEKRIEDLERQVKRRELELERVIVQDIDDVEITRSRDHEENRRSVHDLDWRTGMDPDDGDESAHWYLDHVKMSGSSPRTRSSYPSPSSRNKPSPPRGYSSPYRGALSSPPTPRPTAAPTKGSSLALLPRRAHQLPPEGVFQGVTSRLLQQLRGDINNFSERVDQFRQQRESFNGAISSSGPKRTTSRQQGLSGTRTGPERSGQSTQRLAIHGPDGRARSSLERELYAELTSLTRSNESLQGALDLARQGAEARELGLLRKVDELATRAEHFKRHAEKLQVQNERLRAENIALKNDVEALEEARNHALAATELQLSATVPQAQGRERSFNETGTSPIPSPIPHGNGYHDNHSPKSEADESPHGLDETTIRVSIGVQALVVEGVVARQQQLNHAHRRGQWDGSNEFPIDVHESMHTTSLAALPQSTPPPPRRRSSSHPGAITYEAPLLFFHRSPDRMQVPLEGRFPFQEPNDPQLNQNYVPPELNSPPQALALVVSPRHDLAELDRQSPRSQDDVLRLFETIEDGEISMELATPLIPSVILPTSDIDAIPGMGGHRDGIQGDVESDDENAARYPTDATPHTQRSEDTESRNITLLLNRQEVDLSRWSEAPSEVFDHSQGNDVYYDHHTGVSNYDDSYVDVDDSHLGNFCLDGGPDGTDTSAEDQDDGLGHFGTRGDVDGEESSFDESSSGLNQGGDLGDGKVGARARDGQDGRGDDAGDAEPTVTPLPQSLNPAGN